MKQAENSINDIAQALDRHRNTGQKGYRPKQAHCKTLQRRSLATKAIKMNSETIEYIEQKQLRALVLNRLMAC